jgi:hypothetical protein
MSYLYSKPNIVVGTINLIFGFRGGAFGHALEPFAQTFEVNISANVKLYGN